MFCCADFCGRTSCREVTSLPRTDKQGVSIQTLDRSLMCATADHNIEESRIFLGCMFARIVGLWPFFFLVHRVPSTRFACAADFHIFFVDIESSVLCLQKDVSHATRRRQERSHVLFAVVSPKSNVSWKVRGCGVCMIRLPAQVHVVFFSEVHLLLCRPQKRHRSLQVLQVHCR